MKRTTYVTIGIGLLLAACSSKAVTSGASGSPPNISPSVSTSPCLDRPTVSALIDKAQARMQEAADAFGKFDGQTAAAKLREAADAMRSAADLTRPVIAEAATLMNEAADAWVRAADSAEQDDPVSATNSMRTGITFLSDATDAINAAATTGARAC